jgi:primosomal protein N' (replication factor Y)
LPPFSYQALLRAQALDGKMPPLFLEAIGKLARQFSRGNIQILGPVPAPMTKRAGLYRYQLLFQSTRRQDLHGLLDALMPEIEKLKQANKVRWSLDIDPVDLY